MQTSTDFDSPTKNMVDSKLEDKITVDTNAVTSYPIDKSIYRVEHDDDCETCSSSSGHGDAQKSIEVNIGSGLFRIHFNPVVTGLGIIIIWGFIIWTLTTCTPARLSDPTLAGYCTNAITAKWKQWISANMTWFYIASQDAWAAFLIVLYFSKYGKMKLGKDDDRPEFSDVTWFCMLFSCGLGIGLFFSGASEVISHYEPCGRSGNFAGPQRFDTAGQYIVGTGLCKNSRFSLMPDNDRANWAMNLAYYHWGIHAWVVYCIVGLVLGVLCYRHDLPLSMKTCFYPLIGDTIFGPVGDFIDTLSIACTMLGVCTSLGLGVLQLSAGLGRYFPSYLNLGTYKEVILIWCITAVATASVISGVKIGIRRLSEICVVFGLFLMMVVFFVDDSWFLLNHYVQNIGFYFQYLLQMGFYTEAYEILNRSTGPPDGLGPAAGVFWMDSWTMFFWGWWVAWSPFVGVFIAKVSRGRSIREFINGVMTAPILYTFLWFSIFSGVAMKMERQAALDGTGCYTGSGNQPADGVPAAVGVAVRLSCRNSDDRWFDILDQYPGIGRFIAWMSMVCLVLYFVTSSDSGSLVIDSLAANGSQDPPVLTRLFWALTEGACATALIYAGGRNALTALQTVNIVCAMPYTFVLCWLCAAIWQACRKEAGDIDLYGWEQWKYTLMQAFSQLPTLNHLKTWGITLFVPSFGFAPVIERVSNQSESPKWTYWTYHITIPLFFYTWIILLFCELALENMQHIAWFFLLMVSVIGCTLRHNTRVIYKINGDMVSDYFAIFIFPIVALQCCEQCELEPKQKLNHLYDEGEYPDRRHHYLVDPDKHKEFVKRRSEEEILKRLSQEEQMNANDSMLNLVQINKGELKQVKMSDIEMGEFEKMK